MGWGIHCQTYKNTRIKGQPFPKVTPLLLLLNISKARAIIFGNLDIATVNGNENIENINCRKEVNARMFERKTTIAMNTGGE